MVRYVYVDILFGVNLVMNLLILWATARLSDSRARWRLIVLAAAIGALYSVAVALNPETWVATALAKLAALLLMVVSGFLPRSLAQALRLGAFFLTLSFCVAGASLALASLTGLSGQSPSWVALLGGTALAVCGLKVLAERFRIIGTLPTTVKATVHVGDRAVEFEAFLDTGNQLCDPLSGLPVIVVERGAVQSLMPDDVKDAFRMTAAGGEEAIPDLGATSWATRLRLLPFDSIGRTNGLLVGFRPDAVSLAEPDGRLTEHRAIVGIVDRRMSPDGRYNALIGSTFLRKQQREVR